MGSRRGWLGLLGATALLYGLNLILARPSAVKEDAYAAPLVAPSVAQDLSVAAVSIRPLGGAEDAGYLYVRASGMWRCATTLGAVADGPLLEGLLTDFTGATAALRSEAPAETDFGFGAGEALQVTFHGPKVIEAEDGDALLSFDLGRSLPSSNDAGRAFVRRSGERAVYEIDSDPGSALHGMQGVASRRCSIARLWVARGRVVSLAFRG